VIRRHWPIAVCLGLYVVLAMAEFGGSFASLGSGRITGGAGLDTIQEIWWLAWAAHALPQGRDIFLASGQNYPRGQNFGANTSMLALGALFLPITKSFGPVVTYNVALRLGVAFSATSMCMVLRRWTTWWPAAFLGGLLYGFSAYMSQFHTYLFLIFVPLPPLFFLLLHEIVARQHWRQSTTGVLLGVLCICQFFVSTEILASMVVMGVVAVVLFAVFNRQAVAERWRYAVRAIAYSLVVIVPLLFYPVLFTFTGPEHINGPPASPKFNSYLPADLLSTVVPVHRWLDPKQLTVSGVSFVYGTGLYLGIPLVIALLIFVFAFRRTRLILFCGAMALIALVLSLGSPLWIGGHMTSIPLPFAVLTHLPALDGLYAPRFALYTALFASGVLAIGMEQLWRWLSRPDHLGSVSLKWDKLTGSVVLGIVAAVVMIPLAPGGAYGAVPTVISTFFTSKASATIRPGSVVLTYPSPSQTTKDNLLNNFFLPPTGNALLDQAVGGMPFKLIGGYGWFPSPTGHYGVTSAPFLKPSSVQTAFENAYNGEALAQGSKSSTGSLTSDLLVFLHKYDVGTIVVLHAQGWPEVTRYVSSAIGPPVESAGATVWFHVQRLLRSTQTSGHG
jgi:hypothetical protein